MLRDAAFWAQHHTVILCVYVLTKLACKRTTIELKVRRALVIILVICFTTILATLLTYNLPR